MSPGPGNNATDAAVIEASWSDPEQFRIVFTRHYDAIYGYLVRRGGVELGSDVASETFVVAFAQRHRFDTAYESAKPWLYGIASNLLRNQQRTNARRATKSAPVDTDTGEFADTVAWRADAERLVHDSGLAEALAALKPHEREILFLYAFGDLTYAEIAEALDIPIGTVRSRLSRMRGRLLVPLRDAQKVEPR